MSKIKTFQDGTSMGTFSEVHLDDGNKILVSLTHTEVVIFKVGFFGFPSGTIWKIDMDSFLDVIYPEGPLSRNANKTVLEIVVDLVMQYGTVDKITEGFSTLCKR